MKKVIYFLEFVLIKFFFIIFKIIGYRSASSLGFFIGSRFGIQIIPIIEGYPIIVKILRIQQQLVTIPENHLYVGESLLLV